MARTRASLLGGWEMVGGSELSKEPAALSGCEVGDGGGRPARGFAAVVVEVGEVGCCWCLLQGQRGW